MKKLLYTLLAVSIIFSACEEENEEPTNTGNNNTNNTGNTTATIIGTWELTNETFTSTNGYINPTQGTEVITEIETEIWNPADVNQSMYMNFASDGTYTETWYSNEILDNIYTSNYLKQANSLSILDSLGDVDLSFIITTLTNSTLIVNWSSPYYENFWNDTTFFEHYYAVETFKKSNKKMDNSIQSQNKTCKTTFFKQFIDRIKQ